MKTLPVLLFIFLLSNCHSQTITLDNNYSSGNESASNMVYIGRVDSVFYAKTHWGNKGIKLECFNYNNMKMIFDRHLEMPKINKSKGLYVSLLMTGKRLHLLTATYDNPSGKVGLYANLIDIEGNVAIESKHVFSKSKHLRIQNPSLWTSTPAKNDLIQNKSKREFSFCQSPNKERTLFFCEKYSEESSKKGISCKMVDSDLNLVWEKSFNFSGLFGKLENLYVDDRGLVYFITSYKPVLDGVKYSYEINSYDHTLDSLNQVLIENGGNKISSINITLDASSSIYMGGIYINENMKNDIFLSKFKNESLINVKCNLIKLDSLIDKVGRIAKYDETYTINSFNIRDNKLFITAQRSSTHYSSETTYSYGNIFTGAFTDDLGLTWVNYIDKKKKFSAYESNGDYLILEDPNILTVVRNEGNTFSSSSINEIGEVKNITYDFENVTISGKKQPPLYRKKAFKHINTGASMIIDGNSFIVFNALLEKYMKFELH